MIPVAGFSLASPWELPNPLRSRVGVPDGSPLRPLEELVQELKTVALRLSGKSSEDRRAGETITTINIVRIPRVMELEK